jgi:hypothetical protein
MLSSLYAYLPDLLFIFSLLNVLSSPCSNIIAMPSATLYPNTINIPMTNGYLFFPLHSGHFQSKQPSQETRTTIEEEDLKTIIPEGSQPDLKTLIMITPSVKELSLMLVEPDSRHRRGP